LLNGVFNGAMEGDFKAQELLGAVERKSMEAWRIQGWN